MKKKKDIFNGVKIEINNRANCQVDLASVRQVVASFARAYKIKAKEISIAFVGDAEIKKINQVYRSLNQATDVLAFPGEGDDFGEIIIDCRQIKRQAGKFGQTFHEELIFILTHGLLHLAGFRDETEKDRLKMVKLGEKFIKKLKM